MSSRLSQLLNISVSTMSLSYISSKAGMTTSSTRDRAPKNAASFTAEEAGVRKRKQERMLEYLAYPVCIKYLDMSIEEWSGWK